MFASPLKTCATVLAAALLWFVVDAIFGFTTAAQDRPGFANAMVVLCFVAVAAALWHANRQFQQNDDNIDW